MNEHDIAKLLDRYRVTDGDGFKLKDCRTDDSGRHAVDEEQAAQLLAAGVQRLASLQERLYAQDRWALLLSLQAMDAAGKDGTIKHVTTGVNPAGVQVVSFKQPGPEELAHDFLWRVHREVPARGRIGIFNRSHYEEVLVCRVHPELIERQRLPEALRGDKFWKHRLKDIAAWEKYLARQGIVQVKVFLHVSRDEQRRRFLARLDDPSKNWKFSPTDLAERAHWDAYMDAYQDAIEETAADHAPWYVVPADHKWFAHLIVVQVMIAALEALDLRWPVLAPEDRARLEAARRELD